jgi:hypothetical protein
MHDLAFADSARPSRVVCLRRLLQPYSIGHEILLWQTRNPLLLATREEFDALPEADQAAALCRAVVVCSRNWLDNQKPVPRPRLWSWQLRKTDWPLALAQFRSYLSAGRTMLPTLNSAIPEDAEAYKIANNDEPLGGNGRALGSPFLAQLILFARTTLDIPFLDTLDIPFAIAGNLYFTHLENDGRLNIENAREAQVRSEMAQHRADAEAERAAQTEALKSLHHLANPTGFAITPRSDGPLMPLTSPLL